MRPYLKKTFYKKSGVAQGEGPELKLQQHTHTLFLIPLRALKIQLPAHKGGVRIGKTPKKLASICCP
jgi:hypothetical protein